MGTKKVKNSKENSGKENEDLREVFKLLTHQIENVTNMLCKCMNK